MASVLAAIRAAVHGVAETYSPEWDEPGATVKTAPAAAEATGFAAIEKAAYEAAYLAGVQEVHERWQAAILADGIAGDGPRMAAAIDALTNFPTMTAEGVVAHVMANYPAAQAADYETQRLAGAAGFFRAPGATSANPPGDAVAGPAAVRSDPFVAVFGAGLAAPRAARDPAAGAWDSFRQKHNEQR